MSAGATRRNSPNGAYARAVFGESYQLAGQNSFDDQQRPWHQVLRLCERPLHPSRDAISSLVGQARFDQDTFDLMRTDLGATANVGPVDMSVNYAEVAPDAVSPDFTTTSTTTTTPTTTTPSTNQQRRQEIVGKGALSLTDTWALARHFRYDLENAQTISDGVGMRYQTTA